MEPLLSCSVPWNSWGAWQCWCPDHGATSLAFMVIPQNPAEEQERPKPKAFSMTWAQRLKRVFAIDIGKCKKCDGPVRIIASVEDPDAIQTILKHLTGDQPSDPWTAHRRQIRPPNKRRYSEFQHIDDILVTISIGQDLDLRASSPNFSCSIYSTRG